MVRKAETAEFEEAVLSGVSSLKESGEGEQDSQEWVLKWRELEDLQWSWQRERAIREGRDDEVDWTGLSIPRLAGYRI